MYQQVDTSIVTVKGQIVIPSKMRRRYGLKKGTKVSLVDHGHEIIIRPLTRDYFDRMAGILPPKGKPLTQLLVEERARDREREDRK